MEYIANLFYVVRAAVDRARARMAYGRWRRTATPWEVLGAWGYPPEDVAAVKELKEKELKEAHNA